MAAVQRSALNQGRLRRRRRGRETWEWVEIGYPTNTNESLVFLGNDLQMLDVHRFSMGFSSHLMDGLLEGTGTRHGPSAVPRA